MVTIIAGNGDVVFSGNAHGNVVITGNNININGKTVYKSSSETIILKVDGDPVNVESDGQIEVKGNVLGDVRASGSVGCENVGGNVNAGGSVICGKVNGKVNAGGSIQMHK